MKYGFMALITVS